MTEDLRSLQDLIEARDRELFSASVELENVRKQLADARARAETLDLDKKILQQKVDELEDQGKTFGTLKDRILHAIKDSNLRARALVVIENERLKLDLKKCEASFGDLSDDVERVGRERDAARETVKNLQVLEAAVRAVYRERNCQCDICNSVRGMDFKPA